MVLGFTGFAQLLTPGRVIDFRLTKIAIFLGGIHHTSISFTVSDTREALCLSLANLMVLFIVIAVNYTDQMRSKLGTN